MKLVRFGEPGHERPGLIDSAGRIRDISGHIDDIGGKALLPDYLTAIRRASPANLPIVDPGVRIGPCVVGVGKIIGVGFNYPDFVAETEMPRLEEPLLFFKAPSAISGPNDDIVLPTGSERADWEIELAVVIGKPGHDIDAGDALNHVAGYCIVNDVSERDYVFTSGGDRSWLVNDWVRGKNYDTFAPLGPWLVTPDEIGDPLAFELWLEVDGVRQQRGNTKNMTYSVAEIISAASRYMSLHSGDVIMTGTPGGSGISRSPEVFLRPGQIVRASITGLGEQCQTVRDLHIAKSKSEAEAKDKAAAETHQREHDWQAIYSPSP